MVFSVAGKFQDIVTNSIAFYRQMFEAQFAATWHFEHKFSCLHLTAFTSLLTPIASGWAS